MRNTPYNPYIGPKLKLKKREIPIWHPAKKINNSERAKINNFKYFSAYPEGHIHVNNLILHTGCNFKCLPCELFYYGKIIKIVIIKLIVKNCRDVSVIVLKGQVSKFST